MVVAAGKGGTARALHDGMVDGRTVGEGERTIRVHKMAAKLRPVTI